MLNNREQLGMSTTHVTLKKPLTFSFTIGHLDIEWKQYAFGHGKTRRKTIGFGKYDKKNRTWSEFAVYVVPSLLPPLLPKIPLFFAPHDTYCKA